MKKYIAIAALAAGFLLPSSQTLALDEHFIDSEAVVGGYDVVAYHTVGEPTEGSAEFSANYQGATWHFASAENLELFNADPAKYAPAYGGWCAVGASKGKKVPTKPEFWDVVDGQLYLNSSQGAHEKHFLARTDEVITDGASNWKRIFATAADKL